MWKLPLTQSGFEDKLAFVVIAYQVDEKALVKKTHLLLGIEIKNMLTVHSQITSLKDLPFRFEGETVGYATN